MKFISKFDRYISALYLVTIITIVLTSYYTFREVIDTYNKNQHLSTIPLFSIVNSEIVRPLNIAHFMANDQLLIRLVEQPTLDQALLLDYLQKLSNQYNMLAFVALEKHDLLLDSTGKAISLNHDKAEWYHRLKPQAKNQFADIGNAQDPHLYFDIKLYNEQHQFIGFIGVGIDLSYFATQFTEYSKRFGFQMYFVDQDNDITLSSTHLMRTDSHHRKDALVNINNLSWYQQFLSRNATNDHAESIIAIDDGQQVISQMPIKELQWRLFIITPPASQQSEYWRLFITRVGFFSAIILLLYVGFYFAIEYCKARIVEDAEIDYLTQLPNRSFLNWKYKKLSGKHDNICAVIGDIDDFKQVNDTYGHQVGDDVLKAIATQLSQCLRNDDICGRWGGEEFVLLLPKATIGQTHEIVERIRANIAATPFNVSSTNHTFHTTISFGISENNRKNLDLETLISHADQALYRAKHQGKNRVEIYQPR